MRRIALRRTGATRWYRAVAALVAIAVATALAACGSSSSDSATAGSKPQAPSAGDPAWQSTVEQAEREGSVVLYISAPDVGERVERAFEEIYDIDLEVVRASTGDLITRIEQERTGGVDGADVAVLAETNWYESNADRLAPLDGPAFDDWPSGEYRSERYFIPTVSPYVIGYNTELVPDGVADYQDALDPAHDTTIGTIDTVSTAVSGWYAWLEETQGDDYLERLAQRKPRFYPSTVPLAQALGSGEVGIALFEVPEPILALRRDGAPIDYTVPEPALGTAYGAAALRDSPNPNAAQVLLNYLASEEGQRVVHGNDGVSASPLGVEGALAIDAVTVWDSSAWPTKRTEDYVRRWKAIFGRS